jgi:outer membrane biosynthesis protein TonB
MKLILVGLSLIVLTGCSTTSSETVTPTPTDDSGLVTLVPNSSGPPKIVNKPKASVKAKPKPSPKPSIKPKPKPSPVEVSYANCKEVRAAGKAPLHRGDPGYSIDLDRDEDGVACE